MARYWLTAYAYVAVLGPQTVFFDSKRKSFCALRSSWVYSLQPMINDWEMPEEQHSEMTSAPLDEYAVYLERRGLLTSVRAEGKKMELLEVETAQCGLVDPADISLSHVGLRKAVRILYAAVLAAWQFRHRTLHELRQERARDLRFHRKGRSHPSDLQVSQLVSAYWRFRPLLPFHRYTDLVDSLTLIEYLSSYMVFPKLVVGVRLMPFTTHTWVQEGSTVFNDNPEFVRQFTPIYVA